MNKFYVDESGSMTKKNLDYKCNRYFIICMVLASDTKKLLRVYKRFISSNIDLLRKQDKNNRMFYGNGKFKEIKGSSLNLSMKKKFIDYFCRNDLISLYYVLSNNNKAEDYFYSNTARAFNYLIKLSIEHNTKVNNIPKSTNYFYIDERNVKTNTKATLREYLNIELVTGAHIQNVFFVEYCQSEVNKLIQIADVFSNIYFNYLLKDKVLDSEIKYMIDNKYIKDEFYFPIS